MLTRTNKGYQFGDFICKIVFFLSQGEKRGSLYNKLPKVEFLYTINFGIRQILPGNGSTFHTTFDT